MKLRRCKSHDAFEGREVGSDSLTARINPTTVVKVDISLLRSLVWVTREPFTTGSAENITAVTFEN